MGYEVSDMIFSESDEHVLDLGDHMDYEFSKLALSTLRKYKHECKSCGYVGNADHYEKLVDERYHVHRLCVNFEVKNSCLNCNHEWIDPEELDDITKQCISYVINDKLNPNDNTEDEIIEVQLRLQLKGYEYKMLLDTERFAEMAMCEL